MHLELNDERVQSLIREYKRKEDREQRLERAEELSAVVRELAEAIVQHYDCRTGTDEMSALLRLCQVPHAAKPSTKRARVDELALPDDIKGEIKSKVVDYGIVGGGRNQIEIPSEEEEQTYQLLNTLVNQESKVELDDAIDRFAALDISGIQAGVLSPIIFCLHPTTYPIINGASRSGMAQLMNYEVSSRLTDYTEEAEKFRELRDRYDLGGEQGNLRDVDWFFYTLNVDSQPSVWIEKTEIHDEYKKPGNGELALGNAVLSPQRSRSESDIYWALRDAEIGDIVVHLLKDERRIVGVSIIGSELITDYDFPDAVERRWDEEQQEQGGYLRYLTDYQELDDPPEIYDDILHNPTYEHHLERIYSDNTGLFYDKNRNIVQGGYLSACPDLLVEILADASPELAGYFRDHGFKPKTPAQLFRISLPASGSRREGFEAAVMASLPAAEIEETVGTTFSRDMVRIWGAGEEGGTESLGDLLLFTESETAESLVAATVYGSDQLSADQAEAVCDAVGAGSPDQYRHLIYLDEVYDIELDATQRQKLSEGTEKADGDFSSISLAKAAKAVGVSDPINAVDAFLDAANASKLYPDLGSDTTSYVWNATHGRRTESSSGRLPERIPLGEYGNDVDRERYRPEKGDHVFAIRPGTGVIGVGTVIDNASVTPLDRPREHANFSRPSERPDHSLAVDWLYMLPSVFAVSLSDCTDSPYWEIDSPSVFQRPADQRPGQDLYEAVRKQYIAHNDTTASEHHQNKDIKRLLDAKKQLVFYGPPGTGKTYTARRFANWARAMADSNVVGIDQVRTVTFHPSFSYEDFVEGFTASVENHQVEYDYEKGTFAEIVADAEQAYENSADPDDAPPFFLIIDEINRGNLAQIFGEAITLLEADKRLDQPNELVANLAHSGGEFIIPPNLYILGTMNTADESIALVDTALRRRFRFLSFPPQLEIVINDYPALEGADNIETVLKEGGSPRDLLVAASVCALRTLNERITTLQHLGKGKQIGHTFLLGLDSPEEVVDIWRFELLPQLEEYYFGQFGRLQSDLFQGGGDKLIDWDANQIKDFGAGELYEALCELAGIESDQQVELTAVANEE